MKKLFSSILVLLMLSAVWGPAAADEMTASRRLYALTAPYLTLTDDLPFESLRCFWSGSCDEDGTLEKDTKILVDEDELAALTSVFGQ